MKKLIVLAASLALAGGVMFGCSNGAEEGANTITEVATETETASDAPVEVTETGVDMQYISAEDVLSAVESGDESKIIVDLRNTEDYEAGHIDGAIAASMQKAVENGDYADGMANLTAALNKATGSDTAQGKDVVLVCYSGKKYAQAATDILNALGSDLSNVYTLEGGAKAWDAAGNPMVTD